jgi:hypothetical protein
LAAQLGLNQCVPGSRPPTADGPRQQQGQQDEQRGTHAGRRAHQPPTGRRWPDLETAVQAKAAMTVTPARPATSKASDVADGADLAGSAPSAVAIGRNP